MIPSTKVVPMSLLKYKTKEVDCSSRLQKLTLVLLMFMATGCVSRPSDAEYCTDMRVVPTHEFSCSYMNPWSVICSRKQVYKPICARWA
jgi:hypothetical protein